MFAVVEALAASYTTSGKATQGTTQAKIVQKYESLVVDADVEEFGAKHTARLASGAAASAASESSHASLTGLVVVACIK